ncbi:tyrosine-type recombinase/integrase [Paludisphaera rhizosphaerae]|uniref:tyrosine-type recombinase/integrase n=1 Tax=Paludisphaera rhizosphaerae TaxID=2711216 RepID=UPI0013EDDC37|nr:tyrosine-type recombinase/integrase [Paludisphaera rhizosphaerae]
MNEAGRGLVQRRGGGIILPALIAQEGDRAGRRFVEFFTAQIRNPNTRKAYAQAVGQFLNWCEERRLTLQTLEPVTVAAYVEELGRSKSVPTVKQHLAAVKMLLDWMVIGQIIPVNPAASVRGPKHVVTKGKTPYLSAEDARTLLSSIEPSTLLGLRDRALIAVMTYSFARITAVLSMTVDDYYANGKKWRLRLHEKGGKFLEVPVHHKAEEYLDAYIHAAKIEGDKRGPLFRSGNRRSGELNAKPLRRNNAWEMVKRRAAEVGLTHKLCNHSFRATGITAFIAAGGTIEKAQQIAGHASSKTTQLYNRTSDEITLDEIERIAI